VIKDTGHKSLQPLISGLTFLEAGVVLVDISMGGRCKHSPEEEVLVPPHRCDDRLFCQIKALVLWSFVLAHAIVITRDSAETVLCVM
jgi:hypothetical protein